MLSRSSQFTLQHPRSESPLSNVVMSVFTELRAFQRTLDTASGTRHSGKTVLVTGASYSALGVLSLTHSSQEERVVLVDR